MGADFVTGVKCTIFWLIRGLRVYFEMYTPDKKKGLVSTFFQLSIQKNTQKYFKVFFLEICCKQIKIYNQTSIEQKYGAFYINKESTL